MSKEYTAFNGDAFWNDGYVQELDMAETAVYFHYITSPRLENSGVFKEGQRMVSFYVKTDIDIVKKADEKLEKDGKIYRVGEWVIVPSSLKHQHFDKSPNAIKGIYEQLKKIPLDILQKLKDCGYALDLSPVFMSIEPDKSVNPSGTPPDPLPNPSEPLPEPLSNPSGTHPLYSDSDSDQDIDLDKEFKESLKPDTHFSEISDSEKLFLHIWQHNPDVFNVVARIESPKEWQNYWKTAPPTCEEVQIAMDNFIEAVKSGAIEPRYVPSMPDRFVLKGWITKCQKRFQNKTAPPSGSRSPPAALAGRTSLGGIDDE